MLRKWVRRTVLVAGSMVFGVLATGIAAYVSYLRSQPELKPWHRARLGSEYRAGLTPAEVPDLAAYVAREERLFQELHDEVYARVAPGDRRQWSRYHAGSLADPGTEGTNWNRTFEWRPEQPRGGVLLLHGLSDGPYSLRALGQALYARGYHVLGLRLPGHGTAPVGLARATLEDFVAATRLGVRHVRDRIGPGRPLHLIGYSNGGALAVDYALGRLEGEAGPEVQGVVLISPAIGVSPVAALAAWQRRLAALPGMEKALWESIGPEYDPYKYNSFAVNAGDQVYRLTLRIEERLARLARSGKGVAGFPPLLAFQSAVDATVVPRAVVDRLLSRLAPDAARELVLFDIGRFTEARALMVDQPESFSEALVADRVGSFAVTALTPDLEAPEPGRVREVRRAAGSTEVVRRPVPWPWPPGVFSLSHVALPFPAEDPVYGNGSGARPGRIRLGHLEARGEAGVMAISPRVLMRLRYNPFYPYLEARVLGFCGVAGDSGGVRTE